MSDWNPGPYTLGKLGRELGAQLPELLRGLPDLLAGLAGPHRLGARARLAAQLRLARLLGCPVCLELFPRLARRAGLDETAVQRALEGRVEGLPAEVAGAVAWCEAVITADGARPEIVPGPAMALSAGQRAHMLQLGRLELVIHSAGLMLLPHALIERALGG